MQMKTTSQEDSVGSKADDTPTMSPNKLEAGGRDSGMSSLRGPKGKESEIFDL